MHPLRNLVLIRLDAPKTEEGGVALPDTAIEQVTKGRIEQVGPEVSDLQIGDRVKVSAYAGNQHVEAGVTYLFCKETDVLAILEREEATGDESKRA